MNITDPKRSGTLPLPFKPTHYLLFIAGLGGLLYGIDVGIIAGALPYLEASAARLWNLSAQQMGLVVAAVLLGSVLSSVGAGAMADAIGRKATMLVAGILFSASIPVIAMADGYVPLLLGRLLQGVSGGLVGVVVPLYLAESLPAAMRGRGTALFQLMLTLGLALAALVGLLVAREVEETARSAPHLLPSVQDHAWRRIFWLSLPPGLLFVVGVFGLAESPRWLLTRGRTQDALDALSRTCDATTAARELQAIQHTPDNAPDAQRDSLLQRRYVLPFLLACGILACNQTTGVNSIMAYAVTILRDSGLSGALANWGDLALKLVNALMTVVALVLVDRKGRKFLLMLGTGGIVLSLCAAGILFQSAESGKRDVEPALGALVRENGLKVDADTLSTLSSGRPMQLQIAYSYGPLTQVRVLPAGTALVITPPSSVDGDSVIGATFRKLHLNPFDDMQAALHAPLHIERAQLTSPPGAAAGYLMLACLLAFIASFAVGPGVCVWLALSELMPTRIRSNGMSIALLINQFVSTVIAAIFLPTVGQHGYAAMFFAWAGCTVAYFLMAAFLLPETRGKSLEEISQHFGAGCGKPAPQHNQA